MAVATLLNERYESIRVVEAAPRCGEGFCDRCGDCLHCYGGDPCGPYDEDGHAWYVYAEKVAAFLEDHPEADVL